MEKNLPQIRSRAIVAAILFLIVSVSSMAQSQVGVNLSTKVALPYEWLGYDCPNVNKGSSFVEPNYVGHTPLLQPKVIRYPGNSSWFDWRRGWYSTSPLVPSKLSSLTRQPNYLENFKKVLDSCHADGMFTLNMITSNLQDQLALLKHADSIGIPVKYVELGAEFYIANTDPEAPEGSATVDSIFPFASAYAKVANVWIDSIHYHFPTAKVAIIGNFEKLSLGRDGTWNDSMRIYTSGREDAWTYHCYFKSNDNDTTVQIGMDDIKIWMGRPDLAMNILSNMSENKMTPGKESWITEYNNDDFTRPTCGRWAHGLYMGLFTLKCKEDTRITNLIAHAISGSAIYGQFFDGSTGFNISEAGDSTNASYVNPPTTSVYGLTASGRVLQLISQAAANKLYSSRLTFSPNNKVTVTVTSGTQTYDAIYGQLFVGTSGSDAIIINSSDAPYTLQTATLFSSSSTYKLISADPLALVATDADVITQTGTLGTSFTMPAFSVLKITSTFIPADAPNVQITVNGNTSICLGDSVKLDASPGFANYLWSNGATTRSITVDSTGNYWVVAANSLTSYWGGDTVHITVNPLPAYTNLSLDGPRDFCVGTGTTTLSPVSIYPNTTTYLWNTGETTLTKTVTTTGGDFYLTVIDANGCKMKSEVETMHVYPLPAPTITASGATSFCFNKSVNLMAPLGYLVYNWSNNLHNDTISVSTSGTYNVQVKDANGCFGNSVNSIDVTAWTPPIPTITVNGGASSYCSGAPVYLSTLTGYSYQWQVANNNIAGATSMTQTPSSSGQYKVVITDTHGCTQKSDPLQITVWNNPSPTITVSGGTSICQGQSTQLSASNTGYVSYLWSTGATSTSINVNSTGNYLLTVTDGNGCVGTSAAKAITINPLPTPTITAGGPIEFCSGSNVVLSVTQTYNSVAWSPSGFGQTKTVSTSGTYNATVTDANGCNGTSNSIAVNVHSLTSPTITSSSGGTNFCSNSGVYLTTTTTGYSYQWIKTNADISGATNQNYTPTSSGNYKLRITDALGCTALSGVLNITLNSPPAPSITGATTVCNGSSATLSANTTFTSYLWSTGATTQSITVNTAGPYTLTVTNASGCSATASVTLQQGAATTPVLSASGPTEFCDGGSVTLSTVPANYSYYSWSNAKVTSTVGITSSGSYTCTVTDANGCTATSAAKSINVHTLPTPIVSASSGPATFCDNAGVYLTNDAVGYTYQWYKSANLLTGETNKNYLTPSTGSYKVQITDNIGCTSTASLFAVIVNAHPTPTITGPTTICGSTPVSLGTSIAYSTYAWSNGATTQNTSVSTGGTYSVTVTDGNGCSGTSSTSLTAGSATTPIISASGATEFCNGGSVTLSTTQPYSSYSWSNAKTTATISVTTSGSYSCTVTDASGCTATSLAKDVTVHTLTTPVVSTSTGGTSWCTSDPVYLTTSSVGYSYQWYKSANLQSGATNQNFTPTSSGSYKVQITDNIGCSSTSSLLAITISSSLTPSITGTPMICNGGSTVLSANTVYSSYLWSTGATTQSITVTTAGTYTLTVSNTSGCSGTASVTVSSGTITLPSVSASGATEFCSGGSVTLNVTPTSYSSYLWSNGNTTSSITVSSSGSYTCTVTNTSGCNAVTAPVAVNVHSVTTPTITTSTGQTTYCANAGVYLSTSSVGYNYQWLKGVTAQTGATNQTYAPTTGGNYKVSISDNIGCSATSGVFAVTINAAPVPSITGTTTICSGASTTLSANTSYTTYLWSTGATTQSISVSTAGTYTLTVSNTTGCTATASVTVHTGSAVIPTLSASGSTEFCNGGSVTLSTVPANYSSYLWSNSKTTATNTVTTSGNYTCTVTDASGCTATSAAKNVNVHTVTTPTAVTSSGATTYCNNSGVYLTTSSVGYNYQWFKGATLQTGATNQNYSPAIGGSYKVQITDNIGCSAMSSLLSVTISTSTTPGITGGGAVCGGSSVTMSADNTYASYLWSTGATTQSITVNTAGTYTLTITNTAGCTGSASKTITAGSATVPVISASGPTEFCNGGSVTLSTVPSNYTSYLWSNAKTMSTITVTTSGNYTCTVTNSSGCTATSAPMSVNVHVLPIPVVTTNTGLISFCGNGSTYLTTSTTGYNYQWLKGAGAVAGATNQNYTPTLTASYKLKITDNLACSATSLALAVTVNAAPVPSITGASSICGGNSTTLSANTTYPSYLWSTGATTQTISVTTAGTYSLTVTNVGGCTGSTSKTLSVTTPPVATITPSGPTQFCDGGTVTLTANPVGTSYLWSDGKVSQTNTAVASGSFSVTVTDANGCKGTSSLTTVTEWPIPATDITATGPITFCAGTTPCTLSAPSGYAYQWKKGATVLTGETNQTYVPTSAGVYKLTTTDTHSCSATSTSGVSITINANPNPNISAQGNMNICSGQSKTLNANITSTVTYQWTKDGSNITGATGTSYVASLAGTYTCIETNVNNCSATSNALVVTANCRQSDGESVELPEITTVQLYPNPASGAVHVEAEFAGANDGEALVEIRDILGKLDYSNKVGVVAGKMETNILLDESFSSGVYFMRVRMNDDYVIKRFVIANKEK